MKMKLLLTAFRGENNSSYRMIADSKFDKVFFTNSFSGIDKNVGEFDFCDYDSVVMFGLDKRLTDCVRIEPCAQNGGHIIKSILNITDISKELDKNNVRNTISNKPTAYLCNYAYYKVLEIMNGQAIFLHIPPQKHVTQEMKENIFLTLQEILYTE